MTALRVTTPPGWWDLPLDPARRHADIVALVDRRLDADRQGERDQVIELLEAAAGAANDAGAVLASQFGVSGPDIRFGASMVVAVHAVANAGHKTLFDRVRELAGDPTDDVTDPDVVVDTVVAPAAGEMVRRQAVQRVALSPDTFVRCLSVQYFLPFLDSKQLVVLTFSSPTTAAADSLLPIFDAIATSISVGDDVDATAPD